MASNNHEHIDQLFRADFDRIEVRFNPHHWDQLQAAISDSAAKGNIEESGNSIRSTAQFIDKSIWLILALGIVLIAFICWMFFLMSPTAERKPSSKPELQESYEGISDTFSNHEDKITTRGLQETNSNTNQLNHPPDSIFTNLKSEINDSLNVHSEDTATKSIDNFIFW